MVIGIGMICTWLNPPAKPIARESQHRMQPHQP
jgi:hypothetical protein